MDDLQPDVKTKGRLAQFVIWFLFITAVFSICARLGTKNFIKRPFGLDDVLIIIAQLVYLAQSITLSLAVSTGFEPNSIMISGETLSLFLKLEYASVSLTILAFALVKFSAHAFVVRLSPSQDHYRITTILSIAVGLWLVAAVGTSLFQCALPTPWDYTDGRRCINRIAWWTFVAVLNIVTDSILVGLYFAIMMNLQMPVTTKSAILAGFSTRLIVVGIASAQLALFRRSDQNPAFVLDLWLIFILNQAVVSSSIVTACVPYLKPFMQGLQSGIIQIGHISADEDELVQLPPRYPSQQSHIVRT
ncbi:hypothetical protein F5Y09DRAFT_30081 [Xylaria sp. FL1042]|nr:hypothetical protein F5Y09DRAFT_30081 [Xylaria sp. FL1042]